MSERSYTPTNRFLASVKTTTGKVQWLGLGILSLIGLLAVFAPAIAQFAPTDPVCRPFEEPSDLHWLGCDDAGHDLFSQLLFGARVSLFVGLSVAFFATCTAVILAILAGLSRGWVDRLIMRLVDVALALPFLPLVIVLGVYLGASLWTQILVIALVMWAQPVRELRSQILSVRSMGFVEASRAMGGNGRHVGRTHILPEVAPLIVPQFVRIAHSAILVETSLSFLGLGDPLQTSWGTILYHANARTAFLTGSWLWWVVPAGLAVSLTVTALAFIGFGYDASLTPRLRHRRKPIEPATSQPDPTAALSIRDLHVSFHSEQGETKAVQGVTLDLHPGELVGLVGESGSGKTTMALAALRLLREAAEVKQGTALLEGQDLLRLSDSEMRNLRGRKLALIPQSAMNALNPVLTIGTQLSEALARGGKHSADQIVLWLKRVGLNPEHAQSYPHELSGGMRQRAVIAIALCNTPDVVIADEPTTGLDVLVQEEIMVLLLELRQSLNLSILFVTHNLPLIARHADRLEVMYHGQIVDRGTAAELRATPAHQHTKDLFDNLPDLRDAKRWQPGKCDNTALLTLTNISKDFALRNAFGLNSGQTFQALKDVSFTLNAGEKLGLVGGSGAGKSTITRLAMGLTQPSSGAVSLTDNALVHLVFQDPYGSMRNAMTIRDVVAEPLKIAGQLSQAEINARVAEALAAVHLPNDGYFQSRLPVALSGGQRQRVAFARALVTRPKVIIADEPTSMLDQSVRMEIMQLMDDLRLRYGTAFLFVTHDIVLARHFCDRIIVLNNGEIVEAGPADDVTLRPSHPYTKKLIEAA